MCVTFGLPHKIDLEALIAFMAFSIPKHNQTETDFAVWRKNIHNLEEVYFTWNPSGIVTLGVNLVKPSIWVHSKLPFDALSQYLILASALQQHFMPGIANPAGEAHQEHAKPPYCRFQQVPEEPPQFKEGDKVVCVDDDSMEHVLRRSCEYVVEEYPALSDSARLKVNGNIFSTSRFKLVPPKERWWKQGIVRAGTRIHSFFKPGDRVICVNNAGVETVLNANQHYVVDYYIPGSPSNVPSVVVIGTTYRTSFSASRFKLVPPKEEIPPFKPGDRVICVDNSSVEHALSVNECYMVESADLSWLQLQFKGGFLASRFKLAPPKEEEKTMPNKETPPPFKPGDRVICVDNLGLEDVLHSCECYIVEEGCDGIDPPSVRVKGISFLHRPGSREAAGTSFFASRFKLAPEEKAKKLSWFNWLMKD
jgi:hypothetical protein